MDANFVLIHLSSNEPIFLEKIPILNEVYIKCIPKASRLCGNFELIVRTVVNEFGERLFDSETIKALISQTDAYIIASNIRAALQRLSPNIAKMNATEFTEFKKDVLLQIPSLEITKCSYVASIEGYFSDCAISNLSDVRFLIYVEMRKKIK